MQDCKNPQDLNPYTFSDKISGLRQADMNIVRPDDKHSAALVSRHKRSRVGIPLPRFKSTMAGLVVRHLEHIELAYGV